MLYHHDGRTYEEAASEAARQGREKLVAQIARDRSTAEEALRVIDRDVPHDALVPLPKFGALSLHAEERGLVAENIYPDPVRFTRFALDQLSEKVGAPAAFVRSLTDAGGPKAELAAHVVAKLASLREERVLVRAVRGEIRGVLSDHFRRIDVRPTFASFIEEAVRCGAVPLSGVISETRASIRVVMPTVFEPVPGEVLAIGLALTNSDVGHSALSLSAFIDRLWCTNVAIRHSELRTVHLGRKLTDEEFTFSERTMKLDSAAQVSAVRDVVAATLAPPKIAGLLDGVRAANEQKIDANGVEAFLKKTLDSKAAVKEATEKFASAEVELLPAGQTTWRLSNVLSLLAQSATDTDKRLDYERAAGEALKLAEAA